MQGDITQMIDLYYLIKNDYIFITLWLYEFSRFLTLDKGHVPAKNL